MSVNYAPVLWNRQKRLYDRTMLAGMAAYLGVFSGLQLWLHPETTAETLIIRASGTLAFLMLHLILCIGPLARMDERLLPLLYNRRHFGVSMCCVALVHGIFNLVQFHALGNADPLVSMFTSNPNYDSFGRFPFEVFGFFALLILCLMAATSHDFWLKNLTPRVWKALHTGVYLAYFSLLLHVLLGVIQLEKSPVLIALTGLGALTVTGLHVWGGILSKRQSIVLPAPGTSQPLKTEAVGSNPRAVRSLPENPQPLKGSLSETGSKDENDLQTPAPTGSPLGAGGFQGAANGSLAAPTGEVSDMKQALQDGFHPICRVDEIAENRAKTVLIGEENIAIFKYDGKLSAVNNLCRHQNGPLGEGKIVDGCITCPWHGYQYLPHNGQSPPPFSEKVETYDLRLVGEVVCVHPKPYPEGTERPPCAVGNGQ